VIAATDPKRSSPRGHVINNRWLHDRAIDFSLNYYLRQYVQGMDQARSR
jgi:hypothetical protein